jgi:N-alpha-acetyltransferase 35, NatC auxiliary subunit
MHGTLAHPAVQPMPNSAASRVFDPYISRRFPTFVPIRIIELPTFEETCLALQKMLDGFEDLTRLSKTHEISNWEVSFFC